LRQITALTSNFSFGRVRHFIGLHCLLIKTLTWNFGFATSKHGFASFPINHSQSHSHSRLYVHHLADLRVERRMILKRLFQP